MAQATYHKSVLPEETLAALNIIPGETYLDATLGGGGHTERILQFGGKVIALDVDQDAISNSAEKFKANNEVPGVWVTKSRNLKIYQINFKDLDQVAKDSEAESFAGILFDLGVSSKMFDSAEKGFSFSSEGPLDMRMDQRLGVKAADLINGLNEGELDELFTRLGEVRGSRRLARDIVRSRVEHKIETTTELVRVVHLSQPARAGEIDPATQVFMALRIAVNDELNNLKTALPKAVELLKPAGRLVVISFHSLEDRIAKDFIKSRSDLISLTKKPVMATKVEVSENRRARSAKMRVAEKVVEV